MNSSSRASLATYRVVFGEDGIFLISIYKGEEKGEPLSEIGGASSE